MKIIREGHSTPDFLAGLDTSSNIILCTLPKERDLIKESNNFPDKFEVHLTRDINLSTPSVINISSSSLGTTFKPELKMSFPLGIVPIFTDFTSDHNQDIFWKIYRSFDLHNSYTVSKNNDIEVLHHHVISNIKFIMYMDTIRMREAGLQMIVKKDAVVSEFFFNWYVQTVKDMPQIEEIYLIIDEEIYKNFANIF